MIINKYIKDNGLAFGVKCEGCKRIEFSTPQEKKEAFIRSLKIAGWYWKVIGQIWFCEKCVEKKLHKN